MAQRTLIQLVDDLDGTELADGEGETVTFALDGSTYEIDLSRENADALRGVIYDYSAHARKASSGRRAAKKTASSAGGGAASGPSAAEVRAWAKDNGHEVPDRGRVPQEVRDAYEAAH